jgi:hypothetical protein
LGFLLVEEETAMEHQFPESLIDFGWVFAEERVEDAKVTSEENALFVGLCL